MTITETIARRIPTRRKPNSARLGRPRTREKKIAAPTNARSNSTSLISATAGVGWDRLDPFTEAIAPTIALANTPAPNPIAIAAGAVQIGHFGSSSGPAAGLAGASAEVGGAP